MRKRVIACRMVRTRKAYKACARGQKPPSCLSAPHASEQSLPRPQPRSCAARDSLASHPGAPVFDHGARGWSGCHCYTRPDDFGLLIAGFDSFHWFRLPIAYEPEFISFELYPFCALSGVWRCVLLLNSPCLFLLRFGFWLLISVFRFSFVFCCQKVYAPSPGDFYFEGSPLLSPLVTSRLLSRHEEGG